jgi:hypothetical protein
LSQIVHSFSDFGGVSGYIKEKEIDDTISIVGKDNLERIPSSHFYPSKNLEGSHFYLQLRVNPLIHLVGMESSQPLVECQANYGKGCILVK